MTAVLVALVSGAFGVIVALIERTRRQNTREHGETAQRIDWVLRAIGRVEHKIDRHVDEHGGAPRA